MGVQEWKHDIGNVKIVQRLTNSLQLCVIFVIQSLNYFDIYEHKLTYMVSSQHKGSKKLCFLTTVNCSSTFCYYGVSYYGVIQGAINDETMSHTVSYHGVIQGAINDETMSHTVSYHGVIQGAINDETMSHTVSYHGVIPGDINDETMTHTVS